MLNCAFYRSGVSAAAWRQTRVGTATSFRFCCLEVGDRLVFDRPLDL